MGKSTTVKKPRRSRELRTASILSAARKIFERDGYEKAKISDIAAEIGVVEGTVFHYFPSKRALVLKLVEKFYEDITGSLRAGLADINGTRDSLHFIVRFHLGVVGENAAFCGVILRESRELDEEVTADIRNLNREYTQSLTTVIKQGISNGELREDISIAMVRNALYGGIEHALWASLSAGEPLDPDQGAEHLTRLLFEGIRREQSALQSQEVTSLIRKLDKLVDRTA